MAPEARSGTKVLSEVQLTILEQGTESEKMREIISVPTDYNGLHFRSRLEAQWAVFFDKLTIKYQYEPKPYQLSTGWYLPDFYLPEFGHKPFIGFWVEIKGKYPTKEEIQKVVQLSEKTGHEAAIFFGTFSLSSRGHASGGILINGDEEKYRCWWSACPECGAVKLEFSGRHENERCRCKSIYIRDKKPGKIIAAYRIAKSFFQQ